jgi:hypothetical protein
MCQPITSKVLLTSLVAAAVSGVAAVAGPCTSGLTFNSITAGQISPGDVFAQVDLTAKCLPGTRMKNPCSFCGIVGLWFQDPKQGWVLVGTPWSVGWTVGCNIAQDRLISYYYSDLPDGKYIWAVSVYNAPCQYGGQDIGDDQFPFTLPQG